MPPFVCSPVVLVIMQMDAAVDLYLSPEFHDSNTLYAGRSQEDLFRCRQRVSFRNTSPYFEGRAARFSRSRFSISINTTASFVSFLLWPSTNSHMTALPHHRQRQSDGDAQWGLSREALRDAVFEWQFLARIDQQVLQALASLSQAREFELDALEVNMRDIRPIIALIAARMIAAFDELIGPVLTKAMRDLVSFPYSGSD